MIVLDFKLEPAEVKKLKAIDLTAVSDTQLDYYLFCGDVIFRVDDVVFDARWGWVPIVDFATQLFCISVEISDGEQRKLEFTESNASLTFNRSGDDIEIVGDYCSARARTSLVVVKHAASVFFHRILSHLASEWPELNKSVAFRQRMNLASRK